MFINATGFYVPEERVDNQHFLELNGLTSEWIEQRTGIRSRSKAKAEENINTMSMEAVRNALPKLPYDITDVDLIVSASYSPYDTVATAAHLAQHEFHIENAKALYLFRLLLIPECVGSCGRVFCYGKSNKSVDPFRRQEFGLL